MRSFRLRDACLAAFVILALACVGYGFLWRRGEVLYAPQSDLIAYHLGAKEVLYRSWQAGRGVPFWREDQLSGAPALTNPQSLYTYPLHALFFFLPPADAMGPTLWFHLVIGAWGFYLLGAVLDLGWYERLVIAVAYLFQFKIILTLYTGWLTILANLTLLPFLFAVVLHLLRRPTFTAALGLGAVGALCLHTGHLQLLYLSSWFLIIYVLREVVKLWRQGNLRTVVAVVGWLAFGSLLALGMAAYLLLPMAAELPLTSRTHASYQFFLGQHSASWRHLLTLLHPEALGSPGDASQAGRELWEEIAYFGYLPLFLSILGAVRGWNRAPTRLLAGGFLASLFLAMDTPLLQAMYALLPGFHLFRIPSRFFFLSSFFGIGLAGIGFEQVRLYLVAHKYWTGWTGSLAAAAILLMSAEGTSYAHGYLRMVPRDHVLPTTDYQLFLSADSTVFRTAPVLRSTLNYGWASGMGLQLVTGFDPFNLRHYQIYLDLLRYGAARSEDARVWADLDGVARYDLLDALNVRYLVSPVPLRLPPGRFVEIGRWVHQPFFIFYRGMYDGNVIAYKNERFLPRAFFVERVIAEGSLDGVITEVGRQSLRDVAVIEGDPQESPGRPSPEDHVMIDEAGGGFLVVEAQSQTRRLLVLSEVWHPGWRASLDGHEVPIQRTNLALMGVWLPPGKHHLTLRFRPIHWKVSLWVSLVSGMIFLISLGAAAVRQWRPARVSSRGSKPAVFHASPALLAAHLKPGPPSE